MVGRDEALEMGSQETRNGTPLSVVGVEEWEIGCTEVVCAERRLCQFVRLCTFDGWMGYVKMAVLGEVKCFGKVFDNYELRIMNYEN